MTIISNKEVFDCICRKYKQAADEDFYSLSIRQVRRVHQQHARAGGSPTGNALYVATIVKTE